MLWVLLAQTGLWNDRKCTDGTGFICEEGPAPGAASAASAFACTGKALRTAAASYCIYENTLRGWRDAEKACEANGGTLAVFESPEEESAFRAATAPRVNFDRFWIGLNDAGEEGYWVWTTGEPLTFSLWRANEPNDSGGEDCGEWYVADGSWNDLQCLTRQAFLCEQAN
jgi:hypothetical protein